MNKLQTPAAVSTHSRRALLKGTGGAITAGGLLAAVGNGVYAAEDNTIKVALVGCGGRGTGAAVNALSTKGPVKLWAMADVFGDRLETSFKSLSTKFADKVDVPAERRFIGFDGYRKAIDSLAGAADLVLLTTAPAFRPLHLEYAVEKGVNVFMEKSFAVDAPGIRRVLKAGEAATKKNLKVAGGLMSRHNTWLAEAIGKIHDGAIGDVITCWAYREHGPVGHSNKKPNESELAHQIRNYSCYTWLNGTFLLDWLIHNIDVCCWVKDAWPVSAQGQGGRQARVEPDQLFDHYSVEFTYADGTRMLAQGRHMANCWNFFGDVIHGSKGSGVLGEGIPKPRLYKGWQQTPEDLIWQPTSPESNAYQVEHDLLFDAIRQNKTYNETERCAKSAMAAIMGRMAAESGQMVRWDQALASNVEVAAGSADVKSLDDKAPVQADEKGNYPIAMPGRK